MYSMLVSDARDENASAWNKRASNPSGHNLFDSNDSAISNGHGCHAATTTTKNIRKT